MTMNVITLYEHFIKHPEGGWIMKPDNAKVLYDFVKKYPIKKVLELGLGVGYSASVVALALKQKGEDFSIDAIEQFDKCINFANELIPKELKEHITIHKSNAVLFEDKRIPHQKFSVYEKIPEGDYDLIINDGPSPFMDGEHYIDLPNGVIIQMLDRIKPKTFIAFDGRIESLRLLERFFGDNFWLVEWRPRFAILERKETPFVFNDEKKEYMTRVGYFKGT